jgi:hypothetical protein
MERYIYMAKSKWIKRAEDVVANAERGKTVSDVATALEAAYEEGKHAALHPPKPKPSSAWVSPDPQEIREFWEMVDRLTKVRFGVTWDGMCPVKVWFLDRTRYENYHHFPIPLDFTNEDHHPYHRQNWKKTEHTEEENLARERAIRDNKLDRVRAVGFAVSNMAETIRQFHNDLERAIRQFHNDLERAIRKEDEALPNQIAERIKSLEYKKEKWTGDPDPFSFYEEREGYTIDKEARTYSWVGTMGKNKGKTFTRPIEEKPENFAELMEELERLKKWKYPEPLPWETVDHIPY